MYWIASWFMRRLIVFMRTRRTKFLQGMLAARKAFTPKSFERFDPMKNLDSFSTIKKTNLSNDFWFRGNLFIGSWDRLLFKQRFVCPQFVFKMEKVYTVDHIKSSWFIKRLVFQARMGEVRHGKRLERCDSEPLLSQRRKNLPINCEFMTTLLDRCTRGKIQADNYSKLEWVLV